MFDSSGLKKYYLRSGIGIADESLTSFDCALLNAGIGDYNLIKLSSILPPSSINCSDAKFLWPKGSLIPTAYASKTVHISDRDVNPIFLYSSVSVAIPEDPYLNGLIMEYSGNEFKDGKTMSEVMAINGMKNRDRMCAQVINKSFTVQYNSERLPFIYDIYCSEEVAERNTTRSARVNLDNKYVTLFACCVLG